MNYSQEYWRDVAITIDNIPNVERLYGKRILITGATGMVCSAVIDTIVMLNKKHRAGISIVLTGRNRDRIVSRFSDILNEIDYDFIEYDATKEQILNVNVDFIIHGASNANPKVYSKEPVETLIGNIVGLQSVLEVARKNRNSRLLYISSSEVYGIRTIKTNQPYKEEDYGFVDILNPRACYPIGKRTAETLCVCYGMEYGINTVIVRLGHIYGPSITQEDTRASAAFTRDVASGHDIVMKSEGLQLRSYCYTLDCASAMLTVLINGECGESYNISNKDSIVSIKEMAHALAEAGGVKVVYEHPSDSEIKSYNMMKNSALNADKLEGLGWKAAFSLAEGANSTLKFYK